LRIHIDLSFVAMQLGVHGWQANEGHGCTRACHFASPIRHT
jgi:hypothetical protein